jgi:glycosyltransferase involved in cell wall biosynthesis
MNNLKEKKVLILLSTFNGEAYIEDQLNSLLNQTNIAVNVLIRDDGSTDNTISILDRFAEKHQNIMVIKGKNIGVGASFTQLVLEASKTVKRYDYFAFSDQDDVWLENKMEAAVKRLSEMTQNKPSLYCSNLTLVDKNLNHLRKMYPEEIIKITKGNALVERFGTGCTFLFNEKALDFYSSYPPEIKVLHDRWMFLICLFLGNVYFDNDSYILYRQHHQNVVGAQLGLADKWKSRFRSFAKLKEKPREDQAREFHRLFQNMLSKEDISLLKILTDYRATIKNRIRLLSASSKYDLKMRSKELDFWLKVRIIFGSV